MFCIYQNSIIFPIVNLIYVDGQFLVNIINLNNIINKNLLADMSYELFAGNKEEIAVFWRVLAIWNHCLTRRDVA